MRVGGDDFDRAGALGASWSVLSGGYSCNGERAVATEPGAGITSRALFTREIGLPAHGLAYRYSLKLYVPAAAAGVWESGLLFGWLDAAYWSQGSNPGALGIELYLLSTDGKLYLSRRLFDGSRAIYWSSAALGWAVGSAHEIEATWFLDSTSRVTVKADGATLVTGIAVDLPALNAGMATPATGAWNRPGIHYHRTTTDPAQGEFDLFDVYDLLAGFSVETPPPMPAAPSLTTVTVPGEYASLGAPLPVEPDSSIDLGIDYYLSAVAQGSGWVTRFPTATGSRLFQRFKWNNRTLAERDSLLAWADDPAGAGSGILAFQWTSPEAELFTMFLLPGTISWRKTGPDSYDLAADFMGAHS